MLRAEHHATVYARPTFRTRFGTGASCYQDALRALLTVHEVQTEPSVARLRDSETLGLEELMRRHEHERQQLVMRKLHGEQLSPREEVALQAINAQLERLLPPLERRPSDVTLAVAEARRLSRRAPR
jgi:hypothetical protein